MTGDSNSERDYKNPIHPAPNGSPKCPDCGGSGYTTGTANSTGVRGLTPCLNPFHDGSPSAEPPEGRWGKHVDRGDGFTHHPQDDCDPSNDIPYVHSAFAPTQPQSEPSELAVFLNSLKIHNKDLDACFNDAVAVAHLQALIDRHTVEARVDELEALEHEPQMWGDWQEVIAARLAALRAKSEGAK